MRTILRLLAAACALAALSASAQPAPDVTLARLDCGNGFNDQRRFSDTFQYTDPHVPFTFSCYVIRHGDDVMVWDTGYQPGSNPDGPKVSLVERLAQLIITTGRRRSPRSSGSSADATPANIMRRQGRANCFLKAPVLVPVALYYSFSRYNDRRGYSVILSRCASRKIARIALDRVLIHHPKETP